MVFLLLEPSALQKTLDAAARLDAEVLLGADAMTEKQYQEHQGCKITQFSYELSSASPELVEDALLTIKEHHPGQVIWVQHAN